MISLYIDKKTINSIDEVLPGYQKKIDSSSSKLLPLFNWLEFEHAMINHLLNDMGMPEACNLHLNYKVKPQRGKGTASQTDLMFISGKSSLAIETIWKQIVSGKIKSWLKSGPNPTKSKPDVLAGWLDLLQHHAKSRLNISDFSDANYQMVHRAASACEAGSDPRMAYLLFEPPPEEKKSLAHPVQKDLSHLWTQLGEPAGFPFYLVRVSLEPTSHYNAIANTPRDKETLLSIKKALQEGTPLLTFKDYSVEKIG